MLAMNGWSVVREAFGDKDLPVAPVGETCPDHQELLDFLSLIMFGGSTERGNTWIEFVLSHILNHRGCRFRWDSLTRELPSQEKGQSRKQFRRVLSQAIRNLSQTSSEQPGNLEPVIILN